MANIYITAVLQAVSLLRLSYNTTNPDDILNGCLLACSTKSYITRVLETVACALIDSTSNTSNSCLDKFTRKLNIALILAIVHLYLCETYNTTCISGSNDRCCGFSASNLASLVLYILNLNTRVRTSRHIPINIDITAVLREEDILNGLVTANTTDSSKVARSRVVVEEATITGNVTAVSTSCNKCLSPTCDTSYTVVELACLVMLTCSLTLNGDRSSIRTRHYCGVTSLLCHSTDVAIWMISHYATNYERENRRILAESESR